MAHSLIFTDSPESDDVDLLTQMIDQETPQYGQATPYAFFIKDTSGRILAGANGFVFYGNIYIDQLWVDKAFRKQGYATQILNKIHEYGVQKGCSFASLQTMNFQNAKPFYERLGYKEDFCRKGYVQDSQCFFLTKAL